MQNAFKTGKSFTPRNADYFIWLGSQNAPKVTSIEHNLQRGVCYSSHKQQRWRLFDELTQFTESRHPDPFNRISLDDMDVIQLQRSIRCAISETQMDRLTSRRGVRCWVNTDTTAEESILENGQNGLTTTDEKKRGSSHKISCAKRKHHHRSLGPRCKSASDIRTDLSVHETPVSLILFKQLKKGKRGNCYPYRRRRQVKTDQNALKQFVHELNKGGAMDLFQQVYPTHDSEVDEDAETVGQTDSKRIDQPIDKDYQAKSVHDARDADCLKTETESDSELEITDLVIVDADSSERNANVFLDKSKRALVNPISVLLENFNFEGVMQSPVQTLSIAIEDSVVCLCSWSSIGQPDAYAIDLSPLIRKDTNDKMKNSEMESSFQNVAYLVLREQQSDLNELPTCKQFSAQLQIAMARNCTMVRQSVCNLPSDRLSSAISLDRLVEQAAEAVNRIPKSAINWIACQPYEQYKLVDTSEEPCSSVVNPNRNHVDPCDETLKPTHAVVQLSQVITIQQTMGRTCVLRRHCNFDYPVELCVNQHYACVSCLRPHLDERLNAVCCGVTEHEVCWMCPEPGCSAPLSRLAQLQAAPLQRLAPVWKCADFLTEQMDYGMSRQPVFYANAQFNPKAVLTVWSGSMRSTPSRPENIIFQPSTNTTRCWPRLYFYPKWTPEIHWPASCLAAQKYWRLREHLDDLQHISATLSPDTSGMKPIQLPRPGGERGRFYCDALKIAWRRNVIRQRYCTGKKLSLEYIYTDKEYWRIIDEETLLSWLESLIEMQNVLEYLLVHIEFDSHGKDYQRLLNSMQHLELSLGQHLGVYPITIIPTGTGPKRKQKKPQTKLYKGLSRKVIEKRIMSFEQFKPRLTGLDSAS